MSKEHNVCLQLKKWFNTFDIKCWLNQGEDKFTTKLTQKKPDIIIYSHKIKQYIAIEVKPGDDKNQIRNAVKIIDYWNDYTNKRIEYYINDKKLQIYPSSFCLATLGSMNGKIFQDDGEPRDSYTDTKTQWKQTQLKYKLEPRWEYPKTKEYVRQLWANWRRIRGKNQPGIGVIVADVLNHNQVEPCVSNPLLFDMQWRMSFRGKKQWRQNNFLL